MLSDEGFSTDGLTEQQRAHYVKETGIVSAWLAEMQSGIDSHNLFQRLRDGTVLCELANTLLHKENEKLEREREEALAQKMEEYKQQNRGRFRKPSVELHVGSLAVARQPSLLQYIEVPPTMDSGSALGVARDNVVLFVRWAAQFGVNESLIFQSDDLVLARDPLRVLGCLIAIKRLAQKKFGFEGGAPLTVSPKKPIGVLRKEEQERRRLEQEAEERRREEARLRKEEEERKKKEEEKKKKEEEEERKRREEERQRRLAQQAALLKVSHVQLDKQLSEKPRVIVARTAQMSGAVTFDMTIGVELEEGEAATLRLHDVIPPDFKSTVHFAFKGLSDAGVLVIKAVPQDPFHPANFGVYQLLFKASHSEFQLNLDVVPDTFISLPSQFFTRDSLGKTVGGCHVQLTVSLSSNPATLPEGSVYLDGVTDASGLLRVPKPAVPASFTINVTPPGSESATLQAVQVERVFHKDLSNNNDSNVPPLTRMVARGVGEIVLRWGEQPRDLDSYIACSQDPLQPMYFSVRGSPYDKNGQWLKLDCDVISGGGPETISFNFVPGMRYVYAVHQFSSEGHLPSSNAVVSFNFAVDDHPGKSALQERKVVNTVQQGLRWWVVCVIDGTTRAIHWIDECVPNTDRSILAKYLDPKYELPAHDPHD